jgi:opacity protein-like surface antigen
MKLFQTFLCSFVLAGVAYSQPVVAGLKIGVPFTDAFQNQPFPTVATLTASSNAYTLGPYVEVRLPLHLAIEADALYRGLHFNNITGSASTGRWDFPIVAKYKMFKGPVKPYVEGGLDFSHISDVKNFVTANNTTNFGIVLGAGVEVHALVLRISPEIRYTGDVLKSFSGVINSNRNQVAFLVGIGF